MEHLNRTWEFESEVPGFSRIIQVLCKNMTSIWRENIHGYLSADIILFQDANSYPTAKLGENCVLQGTNNVQGQIYKHIFAQNRGCCNYYPSKILQRA